MRYPNTPSKADARVTMTIGEAAAALGISRASAYAAARRGELPAIRLNRRIVVPRVAFERWLDAAESGPWPSAVGTPAHLGARGRQLREEPRS